MTIFTRVLAAFIGLVAAQLISVPAHAAPPLGKQNWVVSAAGFRTDAYRNYIRLGYIVFNTTSTAVEHNFWTWNQADYPLPIASGDVYYCGSWVPGTNPRNNCAIKTAPGFTGNPNGRFTGTYSYNSATSQVTITWTQSTIDGSTVAVNLVETWNVSTQRTGLARMVLAGDNYSLTYGIAFGSNASLAITSKAPPSAIKATTATYLLEGQAVSNGNLGMYVRGANGGLTMSGWNLCDDGSCMGTVQNNAGCGVSSCCAPGPAYEECAARLAAVNRRFYYLSNAFGGRRNSYEYWCECLSYDACYTRNSHVKPLLQVIDDFGIFQGWVGAEVSPDRTAPRSPAGEPYAAYALITDQP